MSEIRGANVQAERPASLQVAGKGRRKEYSLYYARRRAWGKRKGKNSVNREIRSCSYSYSCSYSSLLLPEYEEEYE